MSVTIEPENKVADFEIVTIEPRTPAELVKPGVLDAMIGELRNCALAVGTDVSTPARRDAVRTAAAKVARSKTFVDGILKDWVSDAKKKLSDVDRLRADMRDRLDALKEEVRAPLTAYEQAEATRIASLRADMTDMANLVNVSALTATADEIRQHLVNLDALYAPDWHEFVAEAKATYERSHAALSQALAVRVKMDTEAAELARLRALQEERDRQDAAARAKAAEAARVELEVRKRQQAAEEARKAETERAARELAAANARTAQEKAAREASELLSIAEKAEAEKRAKAAQEAAVIATQQRMYEESRRQAEEAGRREKNREHRAKVHAEIFKALAEHLEGATDWDTGLNTVIEAIAAGAVPHIRIEY